MADDSANGPDDDVPGNLPGADDVSGRPPGDDDGSSRPSGADDGSSRPSGADDGSSRPSGADGAPARPAADAELGAAVDDAMQAEIKRQLVARIVGLDRAEGVGRSDAYRNDATYRDIDPERPDDPPG